MTIQNDIIEPGIGRTFGILISEDDFSNIDEIGYKPPSISGKKTDLKEIANGLKLAKKLIAQSSAERDNTPKKIV